MNLADCAAIVTGGGSGLGEAAARALAAAGGKVAVFDVDATRGERVARDLDGVFAQVDVADEGEVSAGLERAAARHGEARILVNCAGILLAQKITHKGKPHDLGDFQRVLAVNLIGAFNCARLAATRMARLDPVDGERGVIINTASIAAYDGQRGQTAYAASKAAVAGMTLPLARDLARDAIRVMAIAPGVFRTPMIAALPQETRDALAADIPFPPRLGEPEEYAALVRHLCENRYCNGEVIRLDGGLRMGGK